MMFLLHFPSVLTSSVLISRRCVEAVGVCVGRLVVFITVCSQHMEPETWRLVNNPAVCVQHKETSARQQLDPSDQTGDSPLGEIWGWGVGSATRPPTHGLRFLGFIQDTTSKNLIISFLHRQSTQFGFRSSIKRAIVLSPPDGCR